MSIQSRVHEAKYELHKNVMDLSGFTVHMGLGAYRELLREMKEPQREFGMPVKANYNMADGEIVLRYEVKA